MNYQKYDRLIDLKLYQSEINWLLNQLDTKDNKIVKMICNKLAHASMIDDMEVTFSQVVQDYQDNSKLDAMLEHNSHAKKSKDKAKFKH